jgi:hypothetical protein
MSLDRIHRLKHRNRHHLDRVLREGPRRADCRRFPIVLCGGNIIPIGDNVSKADIRSKYRDPETRKDNEDATMENVSWQTHHDLPAAQTNLSARLRAPAEHTPC